MSTISLPHEKQIRHFFVMAGIASETTIPTFISGATIGEIKLFDTDGAVATAATTKDFHLVKKNQKGSISKTAPITGSDCTYLKGTAPRSKVGKVQTFTLAANPTAGEEYRVNLKVNYGNSEENFISFWGGDIAVSGETKTTMAAKVAKSIADNLASSVNTGSQAPSTVTVAGVAATGKITFTGAAGSVDGITVGGVEIMSGSVAFDTSLTITVAAVAANINANVSVPNYTATAAVGVLTITSVDPGVVAETVVSDTTTMGSTDVNVGTESAGTSTDTADSNKYFKIGAVAGVITITEKDWILEDFRVGLRSYDQLLWNVELQGVDAVTANITKTETAPVFATGQGYQMMELERFLVGHRAEFETKDHTLSFGRDYDTSTASSYYMIDLKWFDTSRDDPKHSEKMLTIVTTTVADANTIGLIIEGMMGYSANDIWVTLT